MASSLICLLLLSQKSTVSVHAWSFTSWWSSSSEECHDKNCNDNNLTNTINASSSSIVTDSNNDIPSNDSPTAQYTAFDSASWAVTSTTLSTKLSPNKQETYDKYIQDCNDAFYQHNSNISSPNNTVCTYNDHERVEMNTHQPSSVYNYTTVGYKKMKTPPALFDLIQKFWNQNKHKSIVEWDHITVYHNLWESPPTIVHIGEEASGGSQTLQTSIWEQTKPILEDWTQHHLSPVSLWGIRSYHNGSILGTVINIYFCSRIKSFDYRFSLE